MIIERTTNPKAKPENCDTLPFGSVFTDHMLEIDWTAKDGWAAPVIKPFGDLNMVSFGGLLNNAIFGVKTDQTDLQTEKFFIK